VWKVEDDAVEVLAIDLVVLEARDAESQVDLALAEGRGALREQRPGLSCVSTGTPVVTSNVMPVNVALKANCPADEAIAEFNNVNASSDSAEKCAECAAANGPPCDESVTPSPP
jgi:hypothetical protein